MMHTENQVGEVVRKQIEKQMKMEKQIEELANFIMREIPGEPSKSEGAVDTAIRLLAKWKRFDTLLIEAKKALEGMESCGYKCGSHAKRLRKVIEDITEEIRRWAKTKQFAVSAAKK